MIALIIFGCILLLMGAAVISFIIQQSKPTAVTEVLLDCPSKIVGTNVRVHLSFRDRLRVLAGYRINLIIKYKLNGEAFIVSSDGEMTIVKRNTSYTTQ